MVLPLPPHSKSDRILTRRQPIHIQACVRTACGIPISKNDIIDGLLTLPGGSWYFGYHVTSEEVQVIWVPSVPLPLDSVAANVTVRLWNISLETLRNNPDMKALGEQPVLEKELDLNTAFTQKLELNLSEFLVFGFEGTGPALGEQENRVGICRISRGAFLMLILTGTSQGDDGWSEEMSAMRTEIEKMKEDSVSGISSLQVASDVEKARLQATFDAEKASLQTAIETREAELQSEMQEKIRSLEQQLGSTMRELGQANETKERVEQRCVLMKGVEYALREDISQTSQERDEIEAKFQELENEAYNLKRALEDANTNGSKQTASIAVLEAKCANVTAELASLLETAVPENKRLRSEFSSLQENLKLVSSDLDDEKAQAADVKATLTRSESNNRSLAQELRNVRNELEQSEKVQSVVEEENDRAAARVTKLENEATKRKERIQDLMKTSRAEQAGREVALSELERLKELMIKGLSEAERDITNLHLKIAGLENRVERITANNNDLTIANLVLGDRLSQEEAERLRAERNNERLRSEITQLRSRVEVTEEQASAVGADLAWAESKLESYQTILKDERARYTKLVNDMKREKTRSADMERRLEGFEATTKPQISKLTDELKNVRAEASKFSDLYDSTRSELQEARREREAANQQAEKQARQLKVKIGQNKKLELEVERAFQRWLEYDKEDMYEQLSNEREDHKRCKTALQSSESEHATDVSRLKSEIERLVGEIKSRDDRIRQHTDSTGDLEGKFQQERLEKTTFDLNVQGLESQVTQLAASLAYEQINRAEFERRFNLEVSNHLSTRLSLGNETQRANNHLKQLSYANSEREFQNARADRLETELIEKKDMLQEAWQKDENQRATIRSLHRQTAARHSNCVELSDVKALIGSYTRLVDTATVRRRNRRQALFKEHFPCGFYPRDGKQHIKFRHEWV